MAAKKKKNKKKKMVKRVILGILAVIFIAGGIYAGPKAFAILRMSRIAKAFVDSSTASTFKESKTTLVYDTNGNELCKIKSSKDMYYVDFSDIPLTLDNAFVVMEDRDFYNHDGIDYKAIVRAAIVNQKSNEIAQGASTITQQLARNIFLTQEVTWQRNIQKSRFWNFILIIFILEMGIMVLRLQQKDILTKVFHSLHCRNRPL